MVAGSKPNEKDNTRKTKLIILKQTVRPSNISDVHKDICVFKEG